MRSLGAILCMASMITILFAGCTDAAPADEEPVAVDKETFELEAGKGAIAGLLVDDRFRPIQLVDNPVSEFQAKGFVLLQETGQQIQTTENGEFTFVDLEPGTYTLRLTVEGHEAIPQRMSVEEGLFNEVSVVARRMSSDNGLIVTEHFAAFATCLPNFIALSFRLDCSGDLSGDSGRSGFVRDYSVYPDVTWVVPEALFNQDPRAGSSFDITVRGGFDYDYSGCVLFEGRYCKMHIVNGDVSPDPVPPGDHFQPWFAHNETLSMEMFGRGYFAEEIRTTWEPVYEFMLTQPCSDPVYCASQFPMRRGAGVILGVEATFIISIFLGDPLVDPLEYCALCSQE